MDTKKREVLCVAGADSTRTTVKQDNFDSCVEIMEICGIEAAQASLL